MPHLRHRATPDTDRENDVRMAVTLGDDAS